MSEREPNPATIMQFGTGAWANGILAAAVNLEIFTHVQNGVQTPEALVEAAEVSARGIQPLLDGLVALGLLSLKDGSYRNSPDVAFFLVKGEQAYLGDWISLHAEDMPAWSRLHEAVRSGAPDTQQRGDDIFERLTPALIPVSIPGAQIAAQLLDVANAGPIHLLDVGGGAGVFSGVFLQANPEARATQLDAPGVNQVARGFVGGLGVGDRFETIDGDAASVEWGEARYDIGVFSHVAHVLDPQQNMEALRKFHRALRAGGTLVIAEFVLDDDRAGPPMALLFNNNMLLHTERGATYREADYRAWLSEAGFKQVSVERPEGPVALIIATK
jgi:ubiquinone/menaquinone biosynthesis C-methylase UbiE